MNNTDSFSLTCMIVINEPPHDKTNKMIYVPNED